LRPDSILDISHESLIRNWKHLRDWVNSEAISVDWYRNVLEDTRRYRAGESGTWRDPKLSRVAAYLEGGEWNEGWAGQYTGPDQTVPFSEAQAFLQRGIADQEAERRRNKSVKITLRVLTGALVLALATLSLILGQQWIERRQHQQMAITDASLSSRVNQTAQRITELEAKSSSESGQQSAQLKQEIEGLKSQMNQYQSQLRAANSQRRQLEQQANIDHGATAIAVLTETGRLDQFDGQWINTDRKTGGIIQVDFQTQGNRHLVRAFGACTPNPCDMGEADAQPYGPTVSASLDTSTQALVAQYVTTFSRILFVARPAGPAGLVIETFTLFTDSSGRTPYHAAYTMERSTAAK
jgi:hypothetical protein